MKTMKTVDFGSEDVTPQDKTRRVGEVFDAVAGRYDLMNDLMSLGSHRLMKRAAVESTGLRRGQRALDLAGGTGDMAALLARVVGSEGAVVLADINERMALVGRDRMLDAGLTNIATVLADGAELPFADDAFDAVTIAFGLRNFTDKERGLAEMHRVLRVGGRLVVLEFSRIREPLLRQAFDAFKAAWPIVGGVVVGDRAPYRYLVDSIDRHPDQETLKAMLADAGFAEVRYDNMLFGAAALHRGTKAAANARPDDAGSRERREFSST